MYNIHILTDDVTSARRHRVTIRDVTLFADFQLLLEKLFELRVHEFSVVSREALQLEALVQDTVKLELRVERSARQQTRELVLVVAGKHCLAGNLQEEQRHTSKYLLVTFYGTSRTCRSCI